ncbi:MAG: HpcH/HpaI aldolase family protein [Terriglobia bacterium]
MTTTLTQPWTNPLRELLRAGKPTVGITITTNSVEMAAQAASVGFDFLWVEMEHSPVSLETLRNIVLATRGLKAVPLARVPVTECWAAKRVMDAGVMGVIFPFASTPEMARCAAEACKYPPLGRRGSGAGLATFRWPPAEDYYDFSDRNMLVIAMIEEAAGIECIDEIAATPGVDVLFIGTSDLSFSLGLRGRQNEPKLKDAIEKVVRAARENKKFLGRPAANAMQIQEYVEQGFLFFQSATELGLMRNGASLLLEPLGKAVKENEAQPLY